MSQITGVSLNTVQKESLTTNVISHVGLRELFYFNCKRLIDAVLSLVLLIICFPLMIIIAILIKLDSEGPAIFSQIRLGVRYTWKDGKIRIDTRYFTMYKFRTMYRDTSDELHKKYIKALIDNDQAEMEDIQGKNTIKTSVYKIVSDPRVTRIGKFLRKTSLDELPQFWNIFKNDMSLVGPRPAIPYEVEMYKSQHYRRLGAKPGLTGLWQVQARSSADFDEIVRLDVEYIENQSIWLDLIILLKTPFVVLSCKGAE